VDSLYIKHHDLGIHQWILFLVCGHFGVLKNFFRALEEASTGPWTRFSLHGFFECTGCQGRLLTLHAQTEKEEEGKWTSWANGIAARYKQFIWKKRWRDRTKREAWAAAVVMKGRELAIHPVSLPKTYHKGEWKTSTFLSVRPTVTFSNWKLGGG
jgi:hypothetical protein